MTKVRVKLQPDQSGNPLIQAVLPHVEVINFQKIIPSMNDIFIKVVQGDGETIQASHFTE